MEHNFVRESARYLRIDPLPGQQQESLKIYKLGGT